MYTELDQFLLEAAKSYLPLLSDEQFLALTCDLTNLHDGLIRTVHQQSLKRRFRAPFNVTADVFLCSKDTWQKGDTSVVIQTKTVETYDASKKL